jgi:hypothetical protein
MPNYRIHRLRDHLRQPFRFAPHVSGTANVKPRDYEAGGEVEAETPYAAFFNLKRTQAPLGPGDLLEDENGALRIFKYIGFEPAQWVLPEPRPDAQSEGAAGAAVQAAAGSQIQTPAEAEQRQAGAQ